ncbi:hypothetical protein KDA00_04710, partial [Candidatus Saccharibacteria bacterium]|nr:hypothetical protein [Candidatus Saccharibacteria bacterium]
KAYLITDGLSRYMKEVIYEPETSTVLKGIDLAKSIVGMEDFQRLCQCDTLIKNDYLETLIFSLKRIYISLLRSSKSNNQINKYTNTLRIILEIEQAINNSSINKKLAITNLLCNL